MSWLFKYTRYMFVWSVVLHAAPLPFALSGLLVCDS